MAAQPALTNALQDQYGLRNIRPQWIRRQSVLSFDIIKAPITRTDLSEISAGTLPWNITQAHSVQLRVKALVQVHDVINIANANPRSNQPPRVLQFSMSDGATEFVAVEFTPLGARLSLHTLPGTKIVLLPSALVRRGRVMLTASDFEFFGAPSANIWGSAYQRQIDNALGEAALPNPSHSSFDSIVASRGGQNGAPVIPVHMGGIADAIPATQRASAQGEDDAEDDGFWAHAVQIADRNLNASVANPTPALPQTNAVAHARALPQQRAAPMVIDIEDLPVDCVYETPQSPPHQDVVMHHAQPQHGFNSADHVPDTDIVEIPSTPVFESDAVAQQQSQPASQGDDILNMLQPPSLPFSRLAAATTNVQPNGTTLHRVYSIKTARKVVVQYNGDKLVLFAQLDDGTAIELLPLHPQLAGDITGLETESEQFRADVENGYVRMRTAIRGIHGFIQVHNGADGAHVISVTKGVPDQEVSQISYKRFRLYRCFVLT